MSVEQSQIPSQNPTEDEQKINTEITDELPSQDQLKSAAVIPIFNGNGQELAFGDLFSSADSGKRTIMVIFIRHFFCGSCQSYIRTLSASIPSPDSLPTGTSLVIIGCGSHTLIPMYAKETACAFPIYSDPSRRLFDILGMTRNLSLGEDAPDYIQESVFTSTVKGMTQMLKRIPAGDALKGGDIKQIGGEFLFDVQASVIDPIWCHRMRHTRDHTEVPTLRNVLRLDLDPKD
ncbi:AhpC/TSA antioxidant enzyme-domain-containing protein [Lipomyces kononenkoae]|uniref:AhpC/TSA antioxidant enzyme-domain-containing protein n=1 Tax=Lipomyces kononenkoae TaxID=34357 RepID=A0ACC3T5N8_LIPKO